jgi:hypothetical protein
MGTVKYPEKLLVRKPERKRAFGRTNCTWKDNIKMDIKEMGLEGMD